MKNSINFPPLSEKKVKNLENGRDIHILEFNLKSILMLIFLKYFHLWCNYYDQILDQTFYAIKYQSIDTTNKNIKLNLCVLTLWKRTELWVHFFSFLFKRTKFNTKCLKLFSYLFIFQTMHAVKLKIVKIYMKPLSRT